MAAALNLKKEDIVSKLDELPTLPAVVYELNKIINDPLSSISDVEKLMSNDQSLTTKVLKLVNSAYYAIPGGVTNLGRAIGYIGFDTVHQLVLSTSIIKALEVKGPSDWDLNAFWQHSAGVGIAAETIARMVNHPMPSDLFTCGLTHDMGKVALYTIDNETLNAVSDFAEEKKLTFFEAEKELNVPDHTIIGRLLAEKWKLPTQFHFVINYHHELDPAKRSSASADMNRNIDIVLVANLVIHGMKFGNSGYSKVPGLPKGAMVRLGLASGDQFKKMIKEVKGSLDKAADFVRVLGE